MPRRPLRILLTNNTLGPRSGTELYVRDLALELARLGHFPVAYSPRLGDVAEELRAATIPVIDDLNNLSRPPDIIHGQHHHETLTALLHFPFTPAIQVCHGWAPPQEAPVAYPTIMTHVAVDDLCRERLLTEGGIDEDRVETLYNFVDMKRFHRVREPRSLPKRALVFTNYTREIPAAIREACEEFGIEVLDIAGIPSGRILKKPEEVLTSYDLVFAKARAAMEAMASGCAVILTHKDGLGGLVTPERLETLRRLNFGARTMQGLPLTVANVRAELDRYKAEDVALVTDWVRESATLSGAAQSWVDVYDRAIKRWRTEETQVSATDRLTAAGNYLQSIAELVKASTENFNQRRVAEHALKMAEARLGKLEAENAALRKAAGDPDS